MPPRPMHCCLPGCPRLIGLKRRIRGYWYCCEAHFTCDKGRRAMLPELRLGLETPMRCASCNARISLWRRIQAHEYCSERCFEEHGRNSRPNPLPESAIEWIHGEDNLRIPRGMFVHALFGALILGMATVFVKDGVRVPRVSLELPRPSVVSFETRIESWKPPDLQLWRSLSSAAPAWRLDQGVLHVLNTILLGAKDAIAGTLSFRFSLHDTGSAKFLLSSDAGGCRCLYVELVSSATVLTLTPFSRTLDGVLTRLGNSCIMDRANKSLHDLSIAFSDSRIDVLVNGASSGWSQLSIAPGQVGLASRERDEFRLYRASIALTS